MFRFERSWRIPQGCGMKGIVFLLFTLPAIAAPSDSLLGVTLVADKSGQSLGAPMQIILLLTLLTMLPAILMSATPFLRIVVVLHFLRQALGTQTTPSNQVLVGLALFLSLIVVQPVGTELVHQSLYVIYI
jgi:flagellar biosynthetic protein FliP